MSSLFNNKQQKMANKYSKSMAKATAQGDEFANAILHSLSPETFNESFETISNKGHDFEKNEISSIELNYKAGKKLSADELIKLNDVFAAVTTRLENTGDENDE